MKDTPHSNNTVVRKEQESVKRDQIGKIKERDLIQSKKSFLLSKI